MTRLQVLHVPDCPNAPVLVSRLREVLGDPQIEHRVVRDHDEAVELGMAGSPTLLVDGRDPFTAPGDAASLSCRLYADDGGAPAGAPSTTQLRSVLAGATELDAWQAGSTGARQAALPPPLRALHRAVLRHFLAGDGPPSSAWLAERARELRLDPDVAVADLAGADLVHLGDERVTVAYPFSGVPSGHRVELAGGPAVWAMCAIDALGVPQLAGRDATITAADPSSGEPVRVEMSAGAWRWTPASTVVLVAGTRGPGPSVTCTCGHVNFYVHPEPVRAYLDAHPQVSGRVLDQPTAVELAGAVFGALLDG